MTFIVKGIEFKSYKKYKSSLHNKGTLDLHGILFNTNAKSDLKLAMQH